MAVDVGYWESLLHQLKAYMARARLHDKHQAMLQKQLFKLRQEVWEKKEVRTNTVQVAAILTGDFMHLAACPACHTATEDGREI